MYSSLRGNTTCGFHMVIFYLMWCKCVTNTGHGAPKIELERIPWFPHKDD